MRISIDEACKRLQNNEVVAIPTETVYGLAALLSSEEATQKVFTLKKRALNNPLIIHVQDKKECEQYVDSTPPDFELLADAFWPGPLTLVMKIKEESIPKIARAHLTTAAFRVPFHPMTQELLQKCSPLVAPSANLSGKPSATRPEHIEADFGKDFPVLDGGACKYGVESTILIFQDGLWHLGRQGAISKEALEYVLGYDVAAANNVKPICPGQFFRHYAPHTHLILSKKPSHDYIIGFSDRVYEKNKKLFSLGRLSHPEEVAFHLYDTLRRLDIEGIQEAEVDINIPETGIWATILERLTRAANK